MRVAVVFAIVSTVVAIGAVPRAAAGPLGELEAQLDGKPARVVVDANGALAVDGAAVATLVPTPKVVRLQAADVQGTPTIAATVTAAAGQEAIVFERRGTWQQVLRVPVGGVGPDGDYATAIALQPSGIYRYQTRVGFHRCDGKPALFFAEGWDRRRARFWRVKTTPTEIDAAAPVLTARADPAPAPVPLLYQARVASREPGADDIGALGIPTALDDGTPATAWTEAGAGSSGEGQFFTFEPRSYARAAQLRFVAAPACDGTAKTGCRPATPPRRLALVGPGVAYHVELPATAPGAAYVVDLPAPIVGCVTAVLEGPDAGGTAIGELEVFAAGERNGGGEAILAETIASDAGPAAAAAQVLAHRGPAAVTALDGALARAKNAAARVRLVDALIATKDPAAGPVLARAITELRLPDDEVAAALAALGALGQAEPLSRLAADHDLGVTGRVAAVRAIAAAPGDHAALLVPLAGKGPPELRRAVIEALSAAPVAELAPAAAASQVAAAAGDLWRSVARRGHADPAERALALAAMTAALPAATDYERRYRLVDGLAALGDAAALQAVGALLHQLPAGAERAAIAQVAAHAIGTAPRPEALALAVELARDADPGVRLAALTALGTATSGVAGPWHAAAGPDAIDRVLETALAADTWPEVRRHAAEVLGDRCARTGPARALATAVGSDPEVAVRANALVALVQCKAPGTGALLAVVWDDGKLPLELRQRAIDLSVSLGDAALGPRLLGKLATWRGAALDSADALALAQDAAIAVGRLAPPGAADALLAALGDGAFPEIVAAAASGLGLLGPACPSSARSQLRTLAHNDEQQIALAAGRALAQCGR